jgi:hypothetical protein
MSNRQTATVITELQSLERKAGVEPATFLLLQNALTEVTLLYGIIQKI